MSDEVTMSVEMVSDSAREFEAALKEMQAQAVYAGFPESEKPRENEDGEESPITNAAIAYIQNTGIPEKNIPQREFMVSGIESKREKIADEMEGVGIAALDGKLDGIEQGLHRVGLTAQDAIKAKIFDGPFEPLAESTLKARARRGREGAQGELDRRAVGQEASGEMFEGARPLVDTGQLKNAVTYVVKKD